MRLPIIDLIICLDCHGQKEQHAEDAHLLHVHGPNKPLTSGLTHRSEFINVINVLHTCTSTSMDPLCHQCAAFRTGTETYRRIRRLGHHVQCFAKSTQLWFLALIKHEEELIGLK